MREVVVISGKGGTGKTSLVASFASLAFAINTTSAINATSATSVTNVTRSPVLADCDVDAPNLHLLVHPVEREAYPLRASRKAVIDPDSCRHCGLCEKYCRFGAIHDGQVDSLACEGCGLCQHVCPHQAVHMEEHLSGKWYVSDTRFGSLVHGRLEPGEENSGRLVALIRSRAKELATKQGAAFLITDGPPGIGCPVISAISGADLAVVVTEPTLSGLHDLVRVLGVCRHFQVEAVVCINRYDLNPQGAEAIVDKSRALGFPVVGRIPYDTAMVDAIRKGMPVVEYGDTPASRAVKDVWSAITGHIGP